MCWECKQKVFTQEGNFIGVKKIDASVLCDKCRALYEKNARPILESAINKGGGVVKRD
jgi:hypothetical protein